MSLPTSQQRILDGIADGLRAHDSRLASLFATFNRLTKQEEMPKTEQLARKRTATARTRWRTGRPRELYAAGRAVPLMGAPGASGATAAPAAPGAPGKGVLRGRFWIALVPIVVLTVVGVLLLGWLVGPQGRCAHGTASGRVASSLIAPSGCAVERPHAGRG